MGSASGRDLAQLRNSLRRVPDIKKCTSRIGTDRYLNNLLIESMFARKHYNCLKQQLLKIRHYRLKKAASSKMAMMQNLDQYRDASKNGKAWLAELEREERERTGIKTLKIGYNRIFGYFIEITKSNIHLADLERYERKQTLANAERYITPELKEKEDLILNAEAEGLELEYRFIQCGSGYDENAYSTNSTSRKCFK